MIYFALNKQQVLIDALTGLSSDPCVYACPFCSSKLLLINSSDDEQPGFIHQCHSRCAPTLQEQLFLYFKTYFPSDFVLTIPRYEHTLQGVKASFPDYPHKYYAYPPTTIHFDEVKHPLEKSSLVEVPYEDPFISVFRTNIASSKLLLVFNFYGCDINRDLIEDELYFTSTILEFITPFTNITSVPMTIQSVIDRLKVTFVRNEMAIEEIQAIHRQRQNEAQEIAIVKSKETANLVNLGVIQIRKN